MEHLIYISQNINGSSFGIEAVSVRISLGCNTLFVSSIYVPPSSNVRYYEQVILYMEKILSFGYETIFMGDFNLDFLGNGPGLNRIEHICATLSLDQLVHKATRVTPDTSTCIDLIFTSIKSKHTYTDIIPVTLSDHFLISTTVNLTCIEKGSKSVRTRSYKNFILDDFIKHLVESDVLSKVYSSNCVETAWHLFMTEFLRISHLHAPIRNHKVKIRNCPWITRDILNLIKQRNFLHKVAVRSRSPLDWVNYKLTRNLVTTTIRKRKKEFFSNNIVRNGHNNKEMWKSLRFVLPSKQNTEMDLSPDLSKDQFNSFFTSVGTELTKHLNNSLPNLEIDKPSSQFSFSKIDPKLVYNFIFKLPSKCTMDALDFDNCLLKAGLQVICPILVYIFNLSISTGIVPKDWKSALVTPIYKGTGPKNDPSNYRPISVLPTISKIFESVVKVQICDYLESNSLISSKQYAYLKGRSTQTALHSVVDLLAHQTDKRPLFYFL